MAPNPFLEDQLSALHRGGGFGSFARAFWDRARENAEARPGLVRELRVARRLGLVLAVATGLVLGAEGVPVLVAAWALGLTWLLLTGWTWAELGLVRHPRTDAPAPRIGPANVMTLFRGWAAVPVALVGIYRPGPTVAWVVLCLLAGFTDLFDGTVAIRLGHESRLGRVLDPVLDAFFFSAAAFALARWSLLPAWMAALVALRYFTPVIGGLALLFLRGRSLPVRHTPWGQRSTFATALALLVTWLATRITVPAWLLLALYAVAVVNMALALGGIARRAPRAA
ncbi:MAG: CDP-diacylglycerol---glycerol-3-phosphate 3-phosphatidyltransferase [Chloroflexota bacterium]|jgi:phosphatidylglycerophosphate synthase|nr:CDP-diacylglycerol---glycerol-3-phosphate 3-phosphatidyltransferase [Chloroflexota bacterium]